MSEPWLSVVMPTYNGAAYLPQTLASIEREGADGIEVLAVDDGSTDATVDILRAHAGRLPLRLLPRRRVGNWVANSNFGLEAARGRSARRRHGRGAVVHGRLGLLAQAGGVRPGRLPPPAPGGVPRPLAVADGPGGRPRRRNASPN